MEDGPDLSLPVLQDLIKRDPPAYIEEYLRQYKHFELKLEQFRLTPHKVQPKFSELVAFLSQTSPSYSKTQEEASSFPQKLTQILLEQGHLLHARTREALVSALKHLRSRNQLDCIAAMPTWFHLIASQDKNLRHDIGNFIIKDIKNLYNATKNHKIHAELKSFMHHKMHSSDLSQARKALRTLIQLHKKRIWTDNKTVNLIASGCLAKEPKIGLMSARFLLGHYETSADGLDSDDDEIQEAQALLAEKMGVKKSKNRDKRMDKEKDLAKRLLNRAERKKRKLQEENKVEAPVLYALDNPESLVEEIFSRVRRRSEYPYKYRLVMIDLISRICNCHEIVLNNFFPFVVKYLNPSQRDITVLLASLAQMSHALTPPDDIQCIVKTIVEKFIVEYQTASVITIGLNAVREILSRTWGAIDAETLAQMTSFVGFKDKGVVIATRSLINLYREKSPMLLEKSLRGRDAAMGKVKEEEGDVHYSVPGLELLERDMMVNRGKYERKGIKVKGTEEKKEEVEREEDWEDEMDDDELEMEDDEMDFDEMDLDEMEVEEDEEEEEEKEERKRGRDAEEGEEKMRKKQMLHSYLEEMKKPVVDAGLAAERILTDEDFARIRKLQQKDKKLKELLSGSVQQKREAQSILLRDSSKFFNSMKKGKGEDGEEEERKEKSGKKNGDVYYSSDDEDRDDEEDSLSSDYSSGVDSDEEEAERVQQQLVNSGMIAHSSILRGSAEERKATKEEKLRKVYEGRGDRKENAASKLKNSAMHSIPESVKKRNKPMSMIRQKFDVREKNKRALSEKVQNLKKHIQTLKKKTGGKLKRRRG